MSFNKREVIEQLKFEIAMIRDGGYRPRVHHPREEPRIFRDSITCLNVALPHKEEPCSACLLCDFVPPGKIQEEFACHHIPLNEKGDTVETLAREGDQEKLEAALLSWLYATIARLEKELAQEEAAASPLSN
jgi:hypothetical protein